MFAKSTTCSSSKGRPLTEYPTEAAASEAAAYVAQQHGLDLVPYRCPRCHHWHLSPRERNTPSEHCSFCTGSSGEAKALYRSRRDAARRAQIIGDERGLRLKVYRCPHHQGWHLTRAGD
jgi:hypothetical protein